MPVSVFNTQEPIAYFLTWTTYGTWLPGDARGWKRKYEGGVQQSDPELESVARERMTETAYLMTSSDREIVRTTIEMHCEIRGWHLHIANPRSNHVHVVVTATNYSPQQVLEQLKAWCTRKLKAAGIKREKFWTEGGTGKSINTADDLEQLVYYASEGQDRKHLDH